MAGESYAIPPKDRAVEGILWYIQHHQLASGDRLPGRARAVRRDWRFAYGVACRYHAAHLVWNAREPSRIGYVCVSSQAAEYLPGNV